MISDQRCVPRGLDRQCIKCNKQLILYQPNPFREFPCMFNHIILAELIISPGKPPIEINKNIVTLMSVKKGDPQYTPYTFVINPSYTKYCVNRALLDPKMRPPVAPKRLPIDSSQTPDKKADFPYRPSLTQLQTPNRPQSNYSTHISISDFRTVHTDLTL